MGFGVGAGVFDLTDPEMGFGVGAGVFDLTDPEVGFGVLDGLLFGAHDGSLLSLPSLRFLQRRSCSMSTV